MLRSLNLNLGSAGRDRVTFSVRLLGLREDWWMIPENQAILLWCTVTPAIIPHFRLVTAWCQGGEGPQLGVTRSCWWLRSPRVLVEKVESTWHNTNGASYPGPFTIQEAEEEGPSPQEHRRDWWETVA